MKPLSVPPSRSSFIPQGAMVSLTIPRRSSTLFLSWLINEFELCTPEIPNGVRGLEVTMRSLCRLFVLVMVMGLSMAAWAKSDHAEPSPAATPAARYAGAVDRIFEQE